MIAGRRLRLFAVLAAIVLVAAGALAAAKATAA
jgi:hypothetical protein